VRGGYPVGTKSEKALAGKSNRCWRKPRLVRFPGRMRGDIGVCQGNFNTCDTPATSVATATSSVKIVIEQS
jgi:hypothetical protein